MHRRLLQDSIHEWRINGQKEQKLQSKHNQLDKVKGEALCRKVKVHEGNAKHFVLKEKQFVERSRFEIQRKELKLKEEQYEDREKVLESNEKDFDERLKEQIIIK